MQRFIALAVGIALQAGLASPAAAFRCGDFGKNLAYEGMHKYQILKDCGEPYSRETVGIDNRSGSYRIIEEWLYIIHDTGHNQLYLIRFNRDGIAEEIEWLGTQD